MVVRTEAVSADPMAVLDTEVVRRWTRVGEDPRTCGVQKGARLEWVLEVEARPEWVLEVEARRTWVVAAEARPEWGIEAAEARPE